MSEVHPASELDITADGEHRYRAQAGEDGPTYHVTVTQAVLDELHLTDADEPTLVRKALEVLATQDAGALPREFSLEDAERTYPGLLEQVRLIVGR